MSNDSSLAKFGIKFQINLLRCLINDGLYLQQMFDILKIEYFENDNLRFLSKLIYVYREAYSCSPSVDALRVLVGEKASIDSKKIINELLDVIEKEHCADEQFIKDNALAFCRERALLQGLSKAVDLIDLGDFDSIRETLNDALNAGVCVDRGHDYYKDANSRLLNEQRIPYPTGLIAIDSIIKGGGVAKGELVFIMAFTGVGKSMILNHIGKTNLLAGNTVIHLTLELSENEVAHRYDASITGIPTNEILASKRIVKREIGKLANREYPGKLFIKHYRPKRCSLETIRSYMIGLHSDKIRPNVLIVDYLDLMKPNRRYKEKRDELTDLSEELRGLGDEFDCAVYTGSQTNRTGNNVAIVDAAMIGESIGKAQAADLLIGVGRTAEQRERKEILLYVAKSRLGPDGLAILCKMNTQNARLSTIGEPFYPTADEIKRLNNRASNIPISNKRLGEVVGRVLSKHADKDS